MNIAWTNFNRETGLFSGLYRLAVYGQDTGAIGRFKELLRLAVRSLPVQGLSTLAAVLTDQGGESWTLDGAVPYPQHGANGEGVSGRGSKGFTGPLNGFWELSADFGGVCGGA